VSGADDSKHSSPPPGADDSPDYDDWGAEENPFADVDEPGNGPPAADSPPPAVAVPTPTPVSPPIPPRPVNAQQQMHQQSERTRIRNRLIAFYKQHNPTKIEEPGFDLNVVLESYEWNEARLFRDLQEKYFGSPTQTPTQTPSRSPGPAPAAAAAAAAHAHAHARAGPRKPDVKEKVLHAPEMANVPKIIDGLKHIYRRKIRPLEEMYKFHEFHSPLLTDTDLEAKPMVLLLGQYSVGKTSFIKYLLEREFPGQRIGPEPTTDRFMAIMHGPDERVVPGNAVAIQADKPFTALTKYGMAFLNKFECAVLPAPILEKISFIDTPGVLSGEKQRIGRSYDFPEVIEWFAERADRILLLFDAHKLDISDEFKSAIEALKGHDDKIRVVLNKADMVTNQQLMRVYGALMWSLGKVIATPEVLRVYIGSFWDRPFQNTENAALFEAEMNDLLADLRSLPRNSAVRKVNELVKRARMAKVHAFIIEHLRAQFGWFGKDKTKQQILDKLGSHFSQVQRKHNLPRGDFPSLRRFQERLKFYDIHKFPKLDPKMLEDMDIVLGHDIPRLMKLLPGTHAGGIDEYKHGANVNPFDDANLAIRSAAGASWEISAPLKAKYDNVFYNQPLQNGKLSGSHCRGVFMQSGLAQDALRQIWALSDVDKDNYLDASEFAIAMFLIDKAKAGEAPPEKLPHTLVPPEKRHLHHAQF
jgi:GTPase SAR1 family protein